ncbi:MAG TPA: hypothetical protein VER03_06065 [Bryobacteraceae bacterium]|nr:hypothetical protein [Bryobacteraceae bacterium]
MNVLRSALLVMSCVVSPLLAVDPGLLQYAAPGATEIAGISVGRASSSNLAAGLVKEIGAAGVQEVLVASNRGQGLIAARGSFDRNLVAGKLVESYKGVELYRARRGSGLVAFPEASVALYGEMDVLKAALDQRGATTTALDPVLSAKVDDVGARYDAWFAAKPTPGMKFGKAKLPAQTMELVSGGLTFGSIVRLDAEALMKTEQDAQALVQMVKFFSSMSETGNAKPLLQNADVRAEGAKFVFSTSATEADIELMLGLRKKTAKVR